MPCSWAFKATAAASRGKTSQSSMVGKMCSSSSCPPIWSARAWAAAKHISSVMVCARTSRVPRKIPGKPRELLTWLGKSERPVATILAPASFASQAPFHIGDLAESPFVHVLGLAQLQVLAVRAQDAFAVYHEALSWIDPP